MLYQRALCDSVSVAPLWHALCITGGWSAGAPDVGRPAPTHPRRSLRESVGCTDSDPRSGQLALRLCGDWVIGSRIRRRRATDSKGAERTALSAFVARRYSCRLTSQPMTHGFDPPLWPTRIVWRCDDTALDGVKLTSRQSSILIFTCQIKLAMLFNYSD